MCSGSDEGSIVSGLILAGGLLAASFVMKHSEQAPPAPAAHERPAAHAIAHPAPQLTVSLDPISLALASADSSFTVSVTL